MGRVKHAFSLIEVMTVIAVLALLIAVVTPSLTQARRHAGRVDCLSRQHQIALAIHTYASEHEDHFPIAQYADRRNNSWVTWDTTTYMDCPERAEPGLIWQYVSGNAVQQCPGYGGRSLTGGDPYTGYNYNVSYIGRGENEGDYRGMGTAPARTSSVRFGATAALVGDGGFRGGANKFMRAPHDEGVGEGTVHAGVQAFRHGDTTSVTYIDGHGVSIGAKFRKPGARRSSEALLDWPRNGFLSVDDRAYRHR